MTSVANHTLTAAPAGNVRAPSAEEARAAHAEGAAHRNPGTHSATPESRDAEIKPKGYTLGDHAREQGRTSLDGPSPLPQKAHSPPNGSSSSVPLSHGTSDSTRGVPLHLPSSHNSTTRPLGSHKEIAGESKPHQPSESDYQGATETTKPGIGSKLAGSVDVLVGKATHNEEKVARGEAKKAGESITKAA